MKFLFTVLITCIRCGKQLPQHPGAAPPSLSSTRSSLFLTAPDVTLLRFFPLGLAQKSPKKLTADKRSVSEVLARTWTEPTHCDCFLFAHWSVRARLTEPLSPRARVRDDDERGGEDVVVDEIRQGLGHKFALGNTRFQVVLKLYHTVAIAAVIKRSVLSATQECC